MTIPDQMERIHVGGFHKRVLALIASGMFLDVFDISMLAPILASFVATNFSKPQANATLLFYNFLGLAIGSFLSGFLTDRFGRRTMYQFNLLIYGVASIITAFLPSFSWVMIFRFIIGIGLGGEIVTGYATLSEFLPAERRGRWQAWLATIANCGQTASAFVGLAVLPVLGWRWMFVIVGIPSLVVWFLRRSLPESPRWLAQQGKKAAAQAIIDSMGQGTALKPESSSGGHAADAEPKANVARLFGPRLIRRTVLCMLMAAIWNAVLFGFTAWAPTILVQNGNAIVRSLLYTAIMTLGIPIGAIIAALLIDTIGRRTSIFLYAGLGALSGIGYAFSLHAAPGVLIAFGLLSEFFMQALISTINGAYVPELFPTELRGTGTGLAGAIGRIGGAIIPLVIVSVLTQGGPKAVFFLISALLVVLILLVWGLGEETRQRTLEEIAAPTAEMAG